MDRGFRQSFAPVKVGDEVDVEIESVGEKGDGIAKIKGFVIFVPNTKKGDRVKVKITRVLRKVGFADVVGDANPDFNPEAEQSEDRSEDNEEAQDSEEF